MNGLENKSIQCPYCWEQFETVIDCSAVDAFGEPHQYTEDCYVCCRPIVLTISIDADQDLQVQIDPELAN